MFFNSDSQEICNQSIIQATSLSNKLHYTGTHDNNTAVGWFKDATKEERTNVQSIALPNEAIQATLMRLAKDSNAKISIFPLQDVLGLGPDARMNTPGQKGKNWVGNLHGRNSIGEAIDKELITLRD